MYANLRRNEISILPLVNERHSDLRGVKKSAPKQKQQQAGKKTTIT